MNSSVCLPTKFYPLVTKCEHFANQNHNEINLPPMKMNIRRPIAMILLLSGIKIENRIGATRG
jgi:hypothetical protein